jgi:hypothetical protein
MVAIAALTAVAVWFQLNTIAESNRLQARSIEASNRPWVWVKSVSLIKLSPTETILQLIVTNSGKSPALDLSINGPVIVLRNAPDAPVKIEHVLALTRVDLSWYGESIGPGQDVKLTESYKGALGAEVIAMVLSGRATLSVTQNVVYRDEFSEKPRVHNFCKYYNPPTGEMLTCPEAREGREEREALERKASGSG